MSHALNVPLFFLNCLLFILIYTATKHTINVKIPYTFFILKSLHNYAFGNSVGKKPFKEDESPGRSRLRVEQLPASTDWSGEKEKR